ncbi:YciI family protein [Paucibacter sp. Y2R2-4]|uniref:YciI family protein n=1 Tax=Paucibacter sp. Y2R2-4 TaxID=2893553 RepID=UPI0021E3FCB3|nr:YciI family protein [Paucibacter sp. Y2R2-4]MCV2348776.1 YciI family protein [Paucibacter sp. Y2R2-4]
MSKKAFKCGLAFALLLSAPLLQAQATAEPPKPHVTVPARDIRYVVFHRPGPNWQADKSLFEQPGLQDHIAHYRQLLAAGKLALGGPHLDEQAGGMMIPAAGLSEQEIRAFAMDDPAVKSGLLRVEIRPWLIGMRP